MPNKDVRKMWRFWIGFIPVYYYFSLFAQQIAIFFHFNVTLKEILVVNLSFPRKKKSRKIPVIYRNWELSYFLPFYLHKYVIEMNEIIKMKSTANCLAQLKLEFTNEMKRNAHEQDKKRFVGASDCKCLCVCFDRTFFYYFFFFFNHKQTTQFCAQRRSTNFVAE